MPCSMEWHLVRLDSISREVSCEHLFCWGARCMEWHLLRLVQVWGRCEALTAGLSSDLAEQLRLVLEPQLASKMAGEYRTGKRISMKRVIAYIASHFRKDKIWLRRTRPDKRKYQASPLPIFPQLPVHYVRVCPADESKPKLALLRGCIHHSHAETLLASVQGAVWRRVFVHVYALYSVRNRHDSGVTQGRYTHAQVVVAIDDSRSMGENGCGSFALEAVTLICRAMARLEVGEMGVVSYGGSNSILPLHPLEKPFTDADGPSIMAQMKFSQVPFPPLFWDFLCPNVLLGETGGLLQGPSSSFSQYKHGCMHSCEVTQHSATGLTPK